MVSSKQNENNLIEEEINQYAKVFESDNLMFVIDPLEWTDDIKAEDLIVGEFNTFKLGIKRSPGPVY